MHCRALLAHSVSLCELGKMSLLAEELQTNVPSRWTNQKTLPCLQSADCCPR